MKDTIELLDLNFAPQAMPVSPNLLTRLAVNGDEEAHGIAVDYLHEESHSFSLLFTENDGSWDIQTNLTHDMAVAQHGDCMGASRGLTVDVIATLTYMVCKEHETIAAFHGRTHPVDPDLVTHFSDAYRHLNMMKKNQVSPTMLHTHYLMASPDDVAFVETLPRRPELLRKHKLQLFSEGFINWAAQQKNVLQFTSLYSSADSQYYIVSVTPDAICSAVSVPDFGSTVRCLAALDEAMILPAMQATHEGRRAFELQKKDMLNYKTWRHDPIVASTVLPTIPEDQRPGMN